MIKTASNSELRGDLRARRRAILDIADVKMNFGGVQAVAGASFRVEEGSITGLIGPNGAGKSTLVDIIAGGRKPTSGSIYYQGTDIAGWPAHRVARAGLVRTYQLSSEFPRLTVLENILVATPGLDGCGVLGALRGRRHWGASEDRAIAAALELLQRLGLEGAADAKAGELSGGQKRLLEIARAMSTKAKVLLFDEPLAGVNPTLGLLVEAAIRELPLSGITILLVEHEIGAVERLCDDVVMMAEGRVLTRGSMEALRANREVVDAYLGA